MIREVWNWLCLIGAISLLCVLAPRVALAGAIGLIVGRWHRWNVHVARIMRS